MKQIPTPLLTLIAGIVITLGSLWMGQHHGLMPAQASMQAELVDGLFDVMIVIATAFFIVVEGTIIYFAIRYRQRPGDNDDGNPIEGNLPLEAFWTAIPAIVVIGIGIYSVDVFQQIGGLSPSQQHDHMADLVMIDDADATLLAQANVDSPVAGAVAPLLAEANPPENQPDEFAQNRTKYGYGAGPKAGVPDVVVNVTGMQYAWLFNYPDDGIISGELHIPADRDVQLNLSAQDVIHSFWVPQFRLKQDALPGKETQLRFVASVPGTYPVVCAELCGAYHGGMRSQVIVQTPDEYAQWLSENRVAHAAPEETVAIAQTASNFK
ncbi:MAG: cytochrome c oxidase subunit II [Elainellaceae cyanobacterium]